MKVSRGVISNRASSINAAHKCLNEGRKHLRECMGGETECTGLQCEGVGVVARPNRKSDFIHCRICFHCANLLAEIRTDHVMNAYCAAHGSPLAIVACSIVSLPLSLGTLERAHCALCRHAPYESVSAQC